MRAIHNSELACGSSAVEADVGRADVAMNCDRIARTYRALEYLSFGGALQACREMYLDEVLDCRRALLCGDGDGRFLGALLRRNREVCVDFVDLSAGMIEVAERRASAIGSQAIARTRFHVGDVRELENADGEIYDLITAHFFLDCFSDEDVARVAVKLASCARPGARLLLSDFRIPTRGIGRYVDAAIIRGLYGAFRITPGLRVTRLPDYEGAIERAGFCKERETLKLGGLLTASLWQRI
jgi:ubiquinone/menaquinone biosynthesis C-methylase UbiE